MVKRAPGNVRYLGRCGVCILTRSFTARDPKPASAVLDLDSSDGWRAVFAGWWRLSEPYLMVVVWGRSARGRPRQGNSLPCRPGCSPANTSSPPMEWREPGLEAARVRGFRPQPFRPCLVGLPLSAKEWMGL